MNIAVIDNYDSFVFNLVRYLKEENEGEVNVMRNTEVNYDLLDKCDAILLSPGPGLPEEAGDMYKIIEQYATKKKFLGVCLGHQAIASKFGGALEPAFPIFHGKKSTITVKSDSPLFTGMPAEMEVGRYHSWRVSALEAKSDLEAIAMGEENDLMALQHKTLPIYGVQFHPESILTPNGRQIIKNWINIPS